MEEKKQYFNKIQSDYLFIYFLSFFNLSDIRSIFPLSKRFADILNKDNKKIIRDIQKKIFSRDLDNNIILNHKNFKTTSFSFNKSPIINSIIMEHFLISSSYHFDNGFSVYDLKTNKLNQKIIFKEKNYSYVNSMLYIKEKKIVLIGTNNGYILSFFLNDNNLLKQFWEYKTGFNKEIKNIIYYKTKENYIIISLDSDENINLNFFRIFYVDYNNEKFDENKNEIKYIKTYVIKNILVYNIKYFEKEYDGFICISFNEGNNNLNKNINNIFKKDKIMNNNLAIIDINKIKIKFSNILQNYEYIIKNKTYEELNFDFILKGHKSYICDFLFLKNNNIILSVEYLSPFLFIWDINIKNKIKSILLPHIDSILCLLNISDKYIISSGRDRKIFIYNINEILKENSIINKTEIKCNHLSDIYKLNNYSESNINKIISSSFDKTIKIFITKDNNFDKFSKIILTGHSSSICCVKIDSLRKQILTVDLNGLINIWEYNELYKFYIIIKSIEINSANRKKEYIDDIILLYDNLNSIIKIDRSNIIKIFSLTKEEFLYDYSENNENILKILDFCNFSEFICYNSKNKVNIYNYRIKQKENNIHFEIKKIKEININELNINNAKMTCFEMISWKYKLIGIGYNNNTIIIIKFINNIIEKINKLNYKYYIIDLNEHLNNFNNRYINQIKCIDCTNKKTKEKDFIEFSLSIIISVNNYFVNYNIISNFFELNIKFINKIEFKHDINFFEILNKNIIISSFINNFKIEIIHLPDDEKEENKKKEILIDTIEISEDYYNKLIITSNKRGMFCISNDSIKYLEFN